MSLAARIPLAAPRHVAWLERSIPLGGLAAAATCAAARWPASATLVVVAAASIAIAFVIATRGRGEPLTLFVSARQEVAVVSAGDVPPDGWRLDEATLAWPALAVVSLVRADGGRLPRRVVLASELPVRERRALYRFLLWSIRARQASDDRAVPRDGA